MAFWEILGITVAIIVMSQFAGKAKFRTIAHRRRIGNLEAYSQRMVELAVPEKISNEIVAFLRRWNRIAEFEVRADDDLIDIYGLADADLSDAITTITASCGRTLADPPNKIHPPILVEDIAMFIRDLPEEKPST